MGRHAGCGPKDRPLYDWARPRGFEGDERTYDAVLRNLGIIGEAVKNLPVEARQLAPHVEWKKIAGLRDIVAHAYFGIDNDLIWDVVTNHIPRLIAALEAVDLPPDC